MGGSVTGLDGTAEFEAGAGAVCAPPRWGVPSVRHAPRATGTMRSRRRFAGEVTFAA